MGHNPPRRSPRLAARGAGHGTNAGRVRRALSRTITRTSLCFTMGGEGCGDNASPVRGAPYPADRRHEEHRDGQPRAREDLGVVPALSFKISNSVLLGILHGELCGEIRENTTAVSGRGEMPSGYPAPEGMRCHAPGACACAAASASKSIPRRPVYLIRIITNEEYQAASK
jgi:hypothetical protein